MRDFNSYILLYDKSEFEVEELKKKKGGEETTESSQKAGNTSAT